MHVYLGCSLDEHWVLAIRVIDEWTHGVTEGQLTHPYAGGREWMSLTDLVLQDWCWSKVKVLPPTIKKMSAVQDNSLCSNCQQPFTGCFSFTHSDSYTETRRPQLAISSNSNTPISGFKEIIQEFTCHKIVWHTKPQHFYTFLFMSFLCIWYSNIWKNAKLGST